jgi:S-formylglutathione hydrolase FrmB
MLRRMVAPAASSRRTRHRGLIAAVIAVAVVIALGITLRARLDATGRSYSRTYGAQVVTYTLPSRLLGRRLGEIAVIPAGGGARPLLVLLHGRHDPSRLSWLIPSTSGPASMLSDRFFAGLSRLGARAPVVVLLNGGGHSYYHDRRDGPWASMILREAIPDAVRRFGTRPGRIAIGGESMGGYGAFLVASQRPREFCAVGGHSAALWMSAGQTAPGAFDDAADYARNDVFAAARRGVFTRMRLWMDGGTRDPFRTADAAFVADLRQSGAAVAYHVWPGGHTQSYWNSHMPEYLQFYAAALANCSS